MSILRYLWLQDKCESFCAGNLYNHTISSYQMTVLSRQRLPVDLVGLRVVCNDNFIPLVFFTLGCLLFSYGCCSGVLIEIILFLSYSVVLMKAYWHCLIANLPRHWPTFCKRVYRWNAVFSRFAWSYYISYNSRRLLLESKYSVEKENSWGFSQLNGRDFSAQIP